MKIALALLVALVAMGAALAEEGYENRFIRRGAEYVFEDSGESPGNTKQEVFSMAVDWVAKAFENPGFVTQISDSNRGKLVVGGSWDYPIRMFSMGKSAVHFHMTVRTSDGGYTVKFNRIRFKGNYTIDGSRFDKPLHEMPMFKNDNKRAIKRRNVLRDQFRSFAADLRRALSLTYAGS